MFVWHLWVFFPMTTKLTAWYAIDFTFGLGILIAVVAYGFYTSLAGQPLFGGKLLGIENVTHAIADAGSKSYRLPRTEPLIFLRVVFPLCRTGMAVSTSE